VQTAVHGGNDAEVSAAATQRSEQLLLIVVFGDNDAPVRENEYLNRGNGRKVRAIRQGPENVGSNLPVLQATKFAPTRYRVNIS